MTVNKKLCQAIQEENLEEVKECLKNGAEPLERIDYETYFTPWNWLYSCHHLSIIIYLLKHTKAANYRIPELCGATLIFGAILFKDEEKIRYLVAVGADVNIINENGYTPLYYTIEQSKECRDLIPLLLELGADISIGCEKIKRFNQDGEEGMGEFYGHIMDLLEKLEAKNDYMSLKVHYDRLKKFEKTNLLPEELSDKIEYLRGLYKLDKLNFDDDDSSFSDDEDF